MDDTPQSDLASPDVACGSNAVVPSRASAP
jgi:hypothetical protein